MGDKICGNGCGIEFVKYNNNNWNNNFNLRGVQENTFTHPFSDSCKRVTCGEGKTCMEDQNGLPHCVLCSKQCFNSIVDAKPVCGVNGVTYASTCDLKADICSKGRSINIAYEGRCQGKPLLVGLLLPASFFVE